jgi:hypothetical protein
VKLEGTNLEHEYQLQVGYLHVSYNFVRLELDGWIQCSALQASKKNVGYKQPVKLFNKLTE